MGGSSSKNYQVTFTFRYNVNTQDVTWTASGGNWPWSGVEEPTYSQGAFYFSTPSGIEQSNITWMMFPFQINNYTPYLVSTGESNRYRMGFAHSTIVSLINLVNIMPNAPLTDAANNLRSLQVEIRAVQPNTSSIDQRRLKAVNFSYNFIEATGNESNLQVRVDDDGNLSYNDKEIAADGLRSKNTKASTGIDNLTDVTVRTLSGLNNESFQYHVLVNISNTNGALSVTYDASDAPQVTNVTTDGYVITIDTNQTGLSDISMGEFITIARSGIAVPADLRFTTIYSSSQIIISPNINGAQLTEIIKPEQNMKLSFLFMALATN